MEPLKHECGVAMIRLLKPLEYYQEKYGTWMYGFVGFAAIAFTGCLYLLLDEKKKNKRKHRRKRK